MSFYAIIPAGGVGSRLWPLSRKAAPKFLADLTGVGRSLLQQTVDRLEPLMDQALIVTGSAYADAVAGQVPGAEVIVEPAARGTMGAIGLAAALIEQRDPDAVVGSFAADHIIEDESAFAQAVRSAIAAAEAGYVATIGITPTEPATAYGYIHAGSQALPGVRSVKEFVEKPDRATAQRYVATGEFFWNAGMFVARAQVLLDSLQRLHPEIATPLRALAAAWDGPARAQAVAEYWEALPNAVIDRAIAEPLASEGGVAVIPAVMGWSDVGDYASLAEVIDPAARANQVAPGGRAQQTLRIDSDGALIFSHSKPVVVVGVPGAVVVDMDDVILVTTQDRAQQVKSAVEALPLAGLGHLA